MSTNTDKYKSSKRSIIIFSLSLFIFLYWSLTRLLNIYHYAFVGAVYEFLWFPILSMMFLLPILSAFYLIKEKFSFKSLYLYSILIIGLTFFVFSKPKRSFENSTPKAEADIGISATVNNKHRVGA